MTAVDPLAQDLAESLRGVLRMLDDKYHGLKAVAGVRSNDCSCECCDFDDDAEEIKNRVQDILESEAAECARRALARWEWS